MPYIITSAKKNISAISGTNNDVEFHNKLFDTDDCVITWQDDPTPEEVEAQKAQTILDEAEAKIKRDAETDKEAIIQNKIREIAISALQDDGKLDNMENIIVKNV